MFFNLKGKKIKLDLNRKSQELLILSDDGEVCLRRFARARVEQMAAYVITISGFESIGVTKDGREKFKHVELDFIYPEI